MQRISRQGGVIDLDFASVNTERQLQLQRAGRITQRERASDGTRGAGEMRADFLRATAGHLTAKSGNHRYGYLTELIEMVAASVPRSTNAHRVRSGGRHTLGIIFHDARWRFLLTMRRNASLTC
jgi:hypothetical protein